MQLIKYIERRFRPEDEALLAKAGRIVSEFKGRGFNLTLRGLYYQMVGKNLIRNSVKSYDRLGVLISDGRLAGLIDWEGIEDITREVRRRQVFDSPAAILRLCADSFRFDKWREQESIPEVWVEKDALLGVIEPVCRRLEVPYMSCRGYASSTMLWTAAQRMIERSNRGKKSQATIILHFGDHDPSGLHMTKDNRDRLTLLTQGDAVFRVARIALTMDQITAHRLPPNPAKTQDARFADYERLYGTDSWELDALPPQVIEGLIEEHVGMIRDDEQWARSLRKERPMQKLLDKIAKAHEK